MLLPAPLQIGLEAHLPYHRCWHLARQTGDPDLLKIFQGERGRALHPVGAPGSGCDFLRFHRRMMRHFAWLLQRTPVLMFHFVSWVPPTLPQWVETVIHDIEPDFDLKSAYDGVQKLLTSGTIDQLGIFIEQARSDDTTPGQGIHSCVHRVLGTFELGLYADDRTGGMGNLGTAPLNIFFWTFHGWIDDVYAEWQRCHGELPDRVSKDMPQMHVKCPGEP